MSVTYQIEPVIDVVRAFVNTKLSAIGAPVSVLPLLSAVMQYPFDPLIYPLLILEPISTTADWRRFAAGDVTLTLDLALHEVRLRFGAPGGEEAAALHLLSELAAAIAADYRLDGNVQQALVESIALAEPDTLHRLGIPADELTVFAAASMRLKIIWIESCFIVA
jgi:hypothetical protein